MQEIQTYTAFLGEVMLASGPLHETIPSVKAKFDEDPGASVLIFEDNTGKQVDFDLRGTLNDVLSRVAPMKPQTGPGRPKLGVVSREISLLPRHWAWLEEQANGASATIRRLVDEARLRDVEAQGDRLSRDAISRFMSAMAGNLPGYEEALRALFAGDRSRFDGQIRNWPTDIRDHIDRLSLTAFRKA